MLVMSATDITRHRGSTHACIRHRRVRPHRFRARPRAARQRAPGGRPRPFRPLGRRPRGRGRRGLDDLDGLHAAAAAADGVVHLAFKHEAMASGDYLGAIADDLKAIEAMGAALEGSGKPFVGTGGTLMLAFGGIKGRAGTEQDVVTGGPRVDAENTVTGFAKRGVRSSIIRLSPLVHSSLDHHGFAHQLIGIARAKGVSGYVGDGANRWPAVHTLDAARLYLLALESAPAGSRLHGVGDEGVPFREFAEAIGRHLGLPAVSIAPPRAGGP